MLEYQREMKQRNRSMIENYREHASRALESQKKFICDERIRTKEESISRMQERYNKNRLIKKSIHSDLIKGLEEKRKIMDEEKQRREMLKQRIAIT